MSVDPVVARAVETAKKEFAKTKKTEKGTSSWGSLLSFAGLAPKADEPPAELLFDAFVDELNKLTRAELLTVVPPTEGERRRVYASAATVVAMQMVPAAGLDADDLFDRCNAIYASLSKTPQTLVEHAKANAPRDSVVILTRRQLMIDWMEWRLSHEHLYDTALFYVVEAEYQLHDAKVRTLRSLLFCPLIHRGRVEGC
jgi:hypothetical protein